MFTKTSVRDAFGEALVEAGNRYPDMYVLTAELKDPTRCGLFAKAFPERFLDVGIAEQNMIGIGSGIASCGKMPFMVSYANFACLRAGEQIRNDISYTNFNAKIVALSTGLTFGTGGPTHQSYEDIGIMRAMPNFVVLAPADAVAMKKAVITMAEYQGPVFVRSGRGEEFDVYTPEDCPFSIGKANVLREGMDVAIIACGFMVHQALIASDRLRESGIQARVIDMHTIKPIDREALCDAAETCRLLVTVEEHYRIGGLGSAVADALCGQSHPSIVKIGIDDAYPPIGPTMALRTHLGLDADGIIRAVKDGLNVGVGAFL